MKCPRLLPPGFDDDAPGPVVDGDVLVARLHAAAAALAEGKVEDALDELLAAWRASRHRRIANAIDTLDRAITSALPPVALCVRRDHAGDARHSEWMTIARNGRAADVGRLLPLMCGGSVLTRPARIDTILARGPDPRVARALVAMVVDRRAMMARLVPMWRAVFAALETHGDVRGVEELARVRDEPAQGAKPVRILFAKRLPSVVERLAVRRVERLSSAAASALQEVEASIAATSPGVYAAVPDVPGGAGNEDRLLAEALLRAVEEAPDDDAPRAVYADYLQERGDPRGRFIALQLDRERRSSYGTRGPDAEREGRAAAREEKRLLALHRRGWLGPLVSVLGNVQLRRGFLASCSVGFRPHDGLLARAHDRRFLTVEELAGDVLPVLRPELRALRRVVLFRNEAFAALCELPFATRIEEVILRLGAADFDDTSGAFVERVMSAAWEALGALTTLGIELRPGEPFARLDQHPLLTSGALRARAPHVVVQRRPVRSPRE